MAYTPKSSGKNSARARAATKNGRRKVRHGMKRWMRSKPMMKQGMGGTDKSHRKGRSMSGMGGTYYSDAPAPRK